MKKYALHVRRSLSTLVVLAAGLGAATTIAFDGNSDTWMLGGSEWTQLATTGPSPRYMASMAYDGLHHQAVLFGGWAGVYSNETWIFE